MVDNVSPTLRVLHEIQKLNDNFAALPKGGGNGTFDGMEGRVAKLEAHMETVRADVGQLKSDMRDIRDRMKGLEVKVDHLPSKGFIVAATTAGLALVAALMTAITVYQAKLQAILGVIPR